MNSFNSSKFYILFATLTFCYVFVAGQEERSIAEKLGYPKDSKLLIMHADDIGVSHSVNMSTISAFEKGGISSASIMVPCPWFPEIAEHAKHNPGLDYGLHLTLTAEWKNFKWDGVLPASEIPSLINSEGYFYATSGDVARNANPAEVEKEIRAQIDRAIDFGINPSHLDSHMGSLFQSQELFQIYLKVSEDCGIPAMIPLNMIGQAPGYKDLIGSKQILIDNLMMISPEVSIEGWNEFYTDLLKNMQPGLNEIIVHLAYDDAEMQAITIDHPDFGAAWRQRDYDFVISDEFKDLLRTNNIILVTWGQIQKLLPAISK